MDGSYRGITIFGEAFCRITLLRPITYWRRVVSSPTSLLRGENDASAKERMGTATWLAGKGFRDFTIAGEV